MDEATIPRLAHGFRIRRDEVRNQWVVLGPERAFVPDDIAAEILREFDGRKTLATVIDTLATRYVAPRDQIAADVLAMTADLNAKGLVKV